MISVVIQTPSNVNPGTAPSQKIIRILASISLGSAPGLPRHPDEAIQRAGHTIHKAGNNMAMQKYYTPPSPLHVCQYQ